ncbi:MAG: Rossmann-like and DUF2520 domain-containing protein [Chitinophagales bacterium]
MEKANKLVPDSVSFIGSGRVATQMALAFQNAGISILQIYSRKKENADKLCKLLKEGESTDNLSQFRDDSTLTIIAVSDDAIEQVAGKLNLKNTVLAHTSGTIPLSGIEAAATKTGIFYPLQSFQSDRNPDWNDIPIFLEANEEADYKLLEHFAGKLSNTVNRLDSAERKKLHLAAVFANNFPNYLYHIAYDLMRKEDLPFEWLIPLLKEMTARLDENDPALLQTGPARRGDGETISKHLKMLEDQPEYQKLYREISELILKKFKKPE